MITIHIKDNGRYTILNSEGEDILYEDYYKIELLNNDSFYYCFYLNPSTFLLYHHGRRLFLNQNGTSCATSRYAARFDEIKDYSNETHTFVARLWNENEELLLLDCDRLSGRRFIFVGRECNDNDRSRPVQLLDRSHIFFNCREFKSAWKENYSYPFKDPNVVFGERFDDGSYFTLCKKNGQFHILACYNKTKRELHVFKGIKYDEIEQYHKRYLICKILGKDLFTIYDKTLYIENEVKRVTFAGSYFEIKDGLLRFKSLELDHWVLFKTRGAKIIENNNWTTDKSIVVLDNYIFHGDNDTGWKIYSLDDSEEIYTGWRNIRLTDSANNIKVVVDTNEQSGYVLVNTQDIEIAHSHFIEKLSSELPIEKKEVQHIAPTVTVEKEYTNTNEGSLDTPPSKYGVDTSEKIEHKATNIEKEIEFDNLPERIDYVCIFDQIKKCNTDHLMCNRKASNLASNEIILFIDEKEKSSYCCKYIQKGFNILWHKSTLSVDQRLIDILNSKENKKAFHRVDLTNFDESNIFSKVGDKLEYPNESTNISVDNEEHELYDKTFKFLTEHGFEKEIVLEAMGILMPNFTPQEEDNSSITFTFGNDSYIVQLDSPWMIDNPFRIRRFLRKSDSVFVWINQKVFKEYPNSDNYDYDMLGEGLDGDQYFANNSNVDIKEGKKRILLFKKIDIESLNDPLLLFFDEVEYVDHDIIHQDDVDGREIIIFHLKSKFRKTKETFKTN